MKQIQYTHKWYKLNDQQKNAAQGFIKQLLETFKEKMNMDIQIKHTKAGRAGKAYIHLWQPRVKVPPLTDLWNLNVILHELGHVILGHVALHPKTKLRICKLPSYQREWEAVQFSHRQLHKILALDEFWKVAEDYHVTEAESHLIWKDVLLIQLADKRYMMENIAQARNRRHPMSSVPKDLLSWIGIINLFQWTHAKKVFVPRGLVRDEAELKDRVQIYI